MSDLRGASELASGIIVWLLQGNLFVVKFLLENYWAWNDRIALEISTECRAGL